MSEPRQSPAVPPAARAVAAPGAAVSSGPEGDEALLEALRSSQRLGFLGPQSVERHVRHAGAFVDALRPLRGRIVDLGSGGGVPGLVIAWRRADLAVVLVERRQGRADHLCRLVRRLGLVDRVSVEAVDAARLPAGAFDAVVARSFGSASKTLAIGARLLAPGGRLVVSEPPDVDRRRWPAEEVRRSGLSAVDQARGTVFVAERPAGACST